MAPFWKASGLLSLRQERFHQFETKSQLSPFVPMKIFGRYRRHAASSQLKAFLVFAAVYCVAVQYFRVVSAPDPSSLFFNVRLAYQRRYTSFRINEAKEFISRSRNAAQQSKASSEPSICLAIATVQRNGTMYFDLLLGSLLDGLSNEERKDIIVLPFIANIDPHAHYAYNETWLHDLSDEVLTYDNVSIKDKARMRSQETPNGHNKKALFDYSYMLRRCFDSGAPHILMLEDDVIAADGWFRRMKSAVQELESMAEYQDSIYLRLFYNTRIQGWNSESWPVYLFWSVMFETMLFCVLRFLRHGSKAATRFLTPRTTLFILFFCSPACVGLYFAAGRLTVHPNPTGIHQMNGYGCCSQALLFPRSRVPPLLKYFQRKKTGPRDELIEQYAERNRLKRWALTPSVFQHIGSRSSKWRGNGSEEIGEYDGLTGPERIWNLHFEAWDPEQLCLERGRV